MMDPILEVRMWWSLGIVFIALILPLFVLYIMHMKNRNYLKWWHIPLYFGWVSLWITHGRDIIPDKYDVTTERVYQCEWVDKTVPKYPKID